MKTSAKSTASNGAASIAPSAFIHAADLNVDRSAVPNDSFVDASVDFGGVTGREGDLVEISGYLSDVRCEQNDGDYHGDFRGNDSGIGSCAEVEVPFPGNVPDKNTRARVSEARTKFYSWLGKQETVHVTLIGQLFYDETHHSSTSPGGGRGTGRCATTLWEIHPVLKVFVRQ